MYIYIYSTQAHHIAWLEENNMSFVLSKMVAHDALKSLPVKIACTTPNHIYYRAASGHFELSYSWITFRMCSESLHTWIGSTSQYVSSNMIHHLYAI
jgi:hypothetical protein